MKQRNIKIINACFSGYLWISLILGLKEVFLNFYIGQMVTQYSKLEIIIECLIYIIGRCDF